MPRYDFRTPEALCRRCRSSPGANVALDAAQANYLRNVLRLEAGAAVLVFNGRDGEWRATLAEGGKRSACARRRRADPRADGALDLHYLFAPLKHARLDYMVQKAVEMGASRLQPVLTRHTQVARVNLERMRANAIEAAEQCGILTLPEIAAPIPLDRMICRARSGAPAGVLRRGRRGEGPGRGARRRRAARRARRARSRCWSGPKAASPRTSAPRCSRLPERGAARARAAHPARRHRRGRGAGAGRRRCSATGGDATATAPIALSRPRIGAIAAGSR